MMRKLALVLAIALMPAFGFGVYTYLGSLKTKAVRATAVKPVETKPKFALPGTMIVIQDGGLYKLSGGTFTELGKAGSWSQVAVSPDHTKLVAVSQNSLASELSLLGSDGHVIKQLTHDRVAILDANHWAFYPRISLDGKTVYYSFDQPKRGYQVDLAVWSMPLNGPQAQARRMTTPNDHTGGDVTPIPLSGGALLYVKYTLGATGIASQIWLQSRPLTAGTALTDLASDCNQPSLSPDGKQLAMICTSGKQSGRLVVAPFDGRRLGPMRTVLAGGLNAAPAWAPDGSGLAYLAPAGAGGHFQLWWLPFAVPAVSASPSGSATAPAGRLAPKQVTTDVDLTPTTPLVWY